jgi:hypothetical protein
MWICMKKNMPIIAPTEELSEEEKTRLRELAKMSDKSFLKNVTKRNELDFLLSLVDRQDCQFSYYAAKYASTLDEMDINWYKK